jgi:hypothetical protein
MDYVFTTVHGTYGKRAKWVREDSALCQQLARAVSPAQIVARPFFWSGRNSPFGRRQAALRLQEHLRDGLSQYPDAKHFIIAHSHGGNVAAMSLEDAPLRRRISGLACLSTPFLVARRRPFGSWLEGVLVVGLLLTLLIGLDESVALSVLSGGALSGLLVARLTSLPDRLIKAINIGDLSGLDVLIVRTPADETTPLLALGHLVGWASTRLYAVLPHLVMLATLRRDGIEPRSRALSRVALVVGIPVSVYALYVFFREPATDLLRVVAPFVFLWIIFKPDSAPNPALDPAVIVITLVALMVVVSLLLVTVVTGMGVMMSAAAVGWAGLICGLVVEVAPEAAPPGQWLIRQIPFSSSGPMSVLSLQHSTTYEDPRAIEAIGGWTLTKGMRSSGIVSDVAF